MLLKMKHFAVITAIAVFAGTASFFAVKYFNDHFVVFSQQEIQNIEQNISLLQMQAYQAGKATCSKTL